MKRNVLRLLFALGLALPLPQLSATPVPVQHKEGTSHGFVVLRSQQGQSLATGEVIQTVEGERVTSELVLHFKDGSLYDEITVFSQTTEFRLLTDHLRQQGPSFPNPVDVRIDAASGDVKAASHKDGKEENEEHHLQIPVDVANGLIVTLLKNLPASAPETTVSMVAGSSRVVKLRLRPESEQQFSAGGPPFKATHYVGHIDIGGVAGAIASVAGKQPADLHFWILGGKAPTFVKFTGPLYDQGPTWNIELATVRAEQNRSTSNARRQ